MLRTLRSRQREGLLGVESEPSFRRNPGPATENPVSETGVGVDHLCDRLNFRRSGPSGSRWSGLCSAAGGVAARAGGLVDYLLGGVYLDSRLGEAVRQLKDVVEPGPSANASRPALLAA